jgi:hypothetical protein
MRSATAASLPGTHPEREKQRAPRDRAASFFVMHAVQ